MGPRITVRSTLVVFGVLGVLGVSACSGDDDGSADVTTLPVTTTVAATGPTTTFERPTVISVSVDPGSDPAAEGGREDVTDLRCEPGATGVWKATGTVTNPSSATADYRIYVSFLDADQDTSGLLQVDVTDVAPGAAQPWTGELVLAEEGLTCVLRVERVTGP